MSRERGRPRRTPRGARTDRRRDRNGPGRERLAVTDKKRAERGLCHERLAAIPDAERIRESAAICAQLLESAEIRAAPRIALYAPLPGEVAIEALRVHPPLARSTFCLPRMRGDGRLDFVAAAADETLVRGRHNVWEPRSEADAVVLTPADVVVLPALAYDRAGVRLGRGGGYYDRTFPPGFPRPVLFGVVFAAQLVEGLPRDPHDLSVDAVVTSDEFWRPASELSR